MISFTVYGTPIPQGSMKAFYVKSLGRAVLTSDNKKLKPWRQEISNTALAAMSESGATMLERGTPVQIVANFIFEKPKSMKKSIIDKTTKPDIDKLSRALLDGLTGIVFEDDAQVVLCCLSKGFGLPERTEVRVSLARNSD